MRSIGEYRRMAELKKYLSMRGEAYSNRVGEYNRMARMKEYNSYLICCEKFIEFQYSKDCCIADLQKFLCGRLYGSLRWQVPPAALLVSASFSRTQTTAVW